MMSREKSLNTTNKVQNSIKQGVVNNPIVNDLSLLSYYTDSAKYNKNEIFDKLYSQGLELMGGDKLLKPASTINSVIIRKTTTKGLYKLILSTPESSYKIDYIDEGQLLNNRKYCSGTVSQLEENSYEVTWFDFDDEINIEHYSKEEVIDFMNKNKLIFQS